MHMFVLKLLLRTYIHARTTYMLSESIGLFCLLYVEWHFVLYLDNCENVVFSPAVEMDKLNHASHECFDLLFLSKQIAWLHM